jgi:hypothetical protein
VNGFSQRTVVPHVRANAICDLLLVAIRLTASYYLALDLFCAFKATAFVASSETACLDSIVLWLLRDTRHHNEQQTAEMSA